MARLSQARGMTRLVRWLWIAAICSSSLLATARPEDTFAFSAEAIEAAARAEAVDNRDLGNIVLPENDTFYTAPSGFEKTAPGTILRSRPVPNPLTINNKDAINVKGAWQIQYRTQNSVGEPEAAVMTVLEPYNAKKNSLLVYHYFTDSSYGGCAPSIALQVGNRQDNTYVQLQSLIVVAALSQGWYVSVADDGGPQAAFGSGLQAAYATLDSIRAVKQSGNITGLNPDPITTMYGYSGGALTGSWTTEMHPLYAPELKIHGAALGGNIPNITALVRTFNKGDRASFGPPIILGMSHDYKNLSDWLKENVIPGQEAALRKADYQCFDSNEAYARTELGIYFKRTYQSLMDDPVPQSVFYWGGVQGLRAVPKVPWYLYETIWDDASPVELTDRLVEKYCAAGHSIYYERNHQKLNHSEECIAGLPGAFAWLRDRHNGIPITLGCKTVQVDQPFWGALTDKGGLLLRGLLDGFLAYLGLPVGPGLSLTAPKLKPAPAVSAVPAAAPKAPSAQGTLPSLPKAATGQRPAPKATAPKAVAPKAIAPKAAASKAAAPKGTVAKGATAPKTPKAPKGVGFSFDGDGLDVYE
ncbi:LIP-domain-containing protein [Trichodelitschia bisporula]|uniref:LIP-domain-containing protein n=1 Tax=Trichodelitschia bisporula TaxID=703511 RepID=A0A6G1HS40_9PEZI|nr:LIP-domain-containing protein [Trichodelitschia bisporula]